MPSAKEILAALTAVRETGEPRQIGIFVLEREDTGLRVERRLARQDWLTKEVTYSRSTGGFRYWPGTEAGMRRIARRLAEEHAAEMASRAALGAA